MYNKCELNVPTSLTCPRHASMSPRTRQRRQRQCELVVCSYTRHGIDFCSSFISRCRRWGTRRVQLLLIYDIVVSKVGSLYVAICMSRPTDATILITSNTIRTLLSISPRARCIYYSLAAGLSYPSIVIYDANEDAMAGRSFD